MHENIVGNDVTAQRLRALTSPSALLETASVYKRHIKGVVNFVDVQPSVNAAFTSATMTILFSNAHAPKSKLSAASAALTSLRGKFFSAFEKELANNDHHIGYRGVGAKWQAGTAEGAICIVVTKARNFMFHTALLWTE